MSRNNAAAILYFVGLAGTLFGFGTWIMGAGAVLIFAAFFVMNAHRF